MRTLTFPVISLGSELPKFPKADALADWVKSRYGKESDIISWAVEETVKEQKEFVAFPSAAGEFYRKRIEDALSDDFSFDMKAVSDDVETVRRYFKDCRWSLPSPLSFTNSKKDDDADDVINAFSKFFREMRDDGISGHILLSDNPEDIELEEFSSRKFLWVTPSSKIEMILERSRDIIIDSKDIGLLEDLFDSYNIRYVYVKDADSASLMKTLEMFDADYVCVCGTAPCDDVADYWKKLSEVSVEMGL
ncbi:MAG: hypothetical protein Q4Q53_04305 [Methanocorpusculum sp.]|nr:hypothetical protein [Methanocorpusculum sp.]